MKVVLYAAVHNTYCAFACPSSPISSDVDDLEQLATDQPPRHLRPKDFPSKQQPPPNNRITPQNHPQLALPSISRIRLEMGTIVRHFIFFGDFLGEGEVWVLGEDVVADVEAEEEDRNVAYRADGSG